MIWKEHRDYQQGLLWTLANDPAMPASVRAAMAKSGLCKDEFAGNTLAPNWPPALYVYVTEAPPPFPLPALSPLFFRGTNTCGSLCCTSHQK